MQHFDCESLALTRCGSAQEAGLWITSLPWPRVEMQNISLSGRPTSCIPVGCWPGQLFPRRVLLIANAQGEAPSTLQLSREISEACTPLPQATIERFECGRKPALHCETHRLLIQHSGRSVGLIMGLRRGSEVHWWEACRLVHLHHTPSCLTIEMGGAIEAQHMTQEELNAYQGFCNPFLHKHNWLNGRLYARLHSNGVCEVFAHHINSKFADEGRDLDDVVPIIGFHFCTSASETNISLGPWTGSISEFDIGGVKFDLSEVSRFATPQQPGEIWWEKETLVLQPYSGAELYGGDCPAQRTGDPFIFHAEDKVFPRGMARTLRFSVSLSGLSPCVARYLAAAEWYRKCEELSPHTQSSDLSWTAACTWAHDHVVNGGFEDGSLPRHLRSGRKVKGRVRHEPGWEGELPYALFLTAWRTGASEDYALAMRAAYYFTDVIVDHAVKHVRMHGYAPPAFALPMNRMQGAIAAYLETGDPYLLETAESVTSNAYWLHKNSWPRLAVGRDACFIRSAVLLYRYFGEEFFRRIAFDGVMHVVESQRENGSFGDQGGGSGMHQYSGYVTKPWMGLLALNGVLDYLDLFPGEKALQRSVMKFAAWLMLER